MIQIQETQVQAAPLCVDLDGTLVKTDTLLETLLLLLKQNPLYLLMLPLWLRRGKAYLKQEISRRVALDAASLPYNEALLDYLQEERAAGRKLVLATAADQRIAARIAEHVGLFDEVIASEGGTNRSGGGKLELLKERYGAFAYAGNADVDLQVWRGASEAVVVSPKRYLADKAREVTEVSRVFAEPVRPTWQLIVKAARLHQWAKNLLLFVPLLTSHQLLNPQLFAQAVLAFVAFGLCASSVYLTNDMLDLAADRQHHRKRFRPFASGTLPLKLGFMVTPLFLLSGVALAFFLPPTFLLLLVGYLILTVSYSFYIKQVALLDVILLAALYTVRIVAGGGGHEHPGVTLALSLFDVLLFELGFRQTLFRTRDPSPQGGRQGQGAGLCGGRLRTVGEFGSCERLHLSARHGPLHQQRRGCRALQRARCALADLPPDALLDKPRLALGAARRDAR